MKDGEFRRLSKPALFQRLRETTNLARLQRARARALKTGGAADTVAAATAGAHHEPEPEPEREREHEHEHEAGEAMAVAEAVPSTPGAAAASSRGLRHRAATAASLPGGGKLSPAEAAAAAAAAAGTSKGGARKGGARSPSPQLITAAARVNDRDPITLTKLSQHTFRCVPACLPACAPLQKYLGILGGLLG